MTLTQIAAILALLSAFNVPQTTVDNVEKILEKQPAPVTQELPSSYGTVVMPPKNGPHEVFTNVKGYGDYGHEYGK